MAILSAIKMVHNQVNKSNSASATDKVETKSSFKDRLKSVINDVLDTGQKNELMNRPNNNIPEKTLKIGDIVSDKGMDIAFDFSPKSIIESGLSPQNVLQGSMKDAMQKQFSALGGEISMALMAGIAGQDSATYVAPTKEERLVAEAELAAAKNVGKSPEPSLFGALSNSEQDKTQLMASNNNINDMRNTLQNNKDTQNGIQNKLNLDPRNKMQQILENSSLLKDKDEDDRK
ncbi:hypothetical protein [Psychromonas sp. CD1]|uniref:hypothetical protein n=1 Tax=Psychromonas sp. CD1 TaxID=1979839 RepID=UPI000B9A418A|nr:hypothetical protein [Psychromonas sp. CD1]